MSIEVSSALTTGSEALVLLARWKIFQPDTAFRVAWRLKGIDFKESEATLLPDLWRDDGTGISVGDMVEIPKRESCVSREMYGLPKTVAVAADPKEYSWFGLVLRVVAFVRVRAKAKRGRMTFESLCAVLTPALPQEAYSCAVPVGEPLREDRETGKILLYWVGALEKIDDAFEVRVDPASYFSEVLRDYRISPRALELENASRNRIGFPNSPYIEVAKVLRLVSSTDLKEAHARSRFGLGQMSLWEFILFERASREKRGSAWLMATLGEKSALASFPGKDGLREIVLLEEWKTIPAGTWLLV